MSLWTVFCQDPVSEKKQQIHVSHVVRGGEHLRKQNTKNLNCDVEM